MAKNYIREYWEKICSGEIAVSDKVRRVMADLIDELDDPRDPWIFDIQAATHPIEFIETFCRQSVGQTRDPVRLELWQKAIIQATFGFVDKETGFRRVRELLVMIGRKNGKTTLAAWLALYMLIADNEGGAEIYFLATKKEQAKKGFVECQNVIDMSPELKPFIRRRQTDLYFPITFSTIAPLASEAQSLDGFNSHAVILDELHALKTRKQYDDMIQSMSARRQPLMLMITTAGTVRESIFDDIYSYAEKVIDGAINDPRFLAFIYELDHRAEWTDFRAWRKANPGLGTIKKVEDLVAFVERAKNDSGFLPTVLCKDMNLRETVAGSWLTFEEANNEETFDMEEIGKAYAVGGVDLSATTDLTAVVLLFKKKGEDKLFALCQGFMPADTITARSKEDKVPYDQWARQGLITLCPGFKVDERMVTDWILQTIKKDKLIPYWTGFDRWNSSSWIEDMEARVGYTLNKDLVPVAMGAKTLSAPMKALKGDLAANRINYNNNPLLKWALTNVSIKTDDNENIRPVKGNKRQRIDPAVALIIAYSVMMDNWRDYCALIGDGSKGRE